MKEIVVVLLFRRGGRKGVDVQFRGDGSVDVGEREGGGTVGEEGAEKGTLPEWPWSFFGIRDGVEQPEWILIQATEGDQGYMSIDRTEGEECGGGLGIF